jgi:hypothetical protein
VIKEAAKLKQVTQNLGLRKLSEQLRSNINNTASVTTLISTEHDLGTLQHYRQYLEKNRPNGFHAEDLFLRKNHQEPQSQGMTSAEFKKTLM